MNGFVTETVQKGRVELCLCWRALIIRPPLLRPAETVKMMRFVHAAMVALVVGCGTSAPPRVEKKKVAKNPLSALKTHAHVLRDNSGRVVTILFSERTTDEGLRHVKGLQSLETIFLSDSPITDVGLESLSELTQLQSLSLDSRPVTDAGLQSIEKLIQLRDLRLGSTQISDRGLEHLARMTQLKILNLRHTQITDAGLVHL